MKDLLELKLRTLVPTQLSFTEDSATTHDQDVFSFYPEDSFCNGFEDVLSRYKEIVPHLKISGLKNL
ncbi:hypothetical protein L1887_05512 [Cichorium endivia]|nr:hypothetical protein L1887_05512 [Cichorium endivia]